MCSGPARIFGLPAGSLRPGAPADLTLIDPEREWTVEPELFHSKSRNTPFAGWELKGRATATYVAGAERYADEEFDARKDG
jgi:dihydroorotase